MVSLKTKRHYYHKDHLGQFYSISKGITKEMFPLASPSLLVRWAPLKLRSISAGGEAGEAEIHFQNIVPKEGYFIRNLSTWILWEDRSIVHLSWLLSACIPAARGSVQPQQKKRYHLACLGTASKFCRFRQNRVAYRVTDLNYFVGFSLSIVCQQYDCWFHIGCLLCRFLLLNPSMFEVHRLME